MGISINGPSGIDTSYIIESLVSLERSKVLAVEDQKDAYQMKIDAYTKMQTLIKNIGLKAQALSNNDDFNLFSTTTSNEDLLTFSTTTNGYPGSYDIRVFQTAQREKLISEDALITSKTATLGDMGITPGTFTIDGTEITTEAGDTINDLRYKINNATDANGKSLGVTATILKISDTNYRMVLSNEETGDGGVEYKDTSGNVLQSLGYILDAAGNKGIVNQTVQSADDIATAFSSLAAGDSITYEGVDHDGHSVSATFVVGASSTVDDLREHVANTFHGMAEVTVSDTDGTLSITSKIGGVSQLAINSFSIEGTQYAFNKTQSGMAQSNVLSVGRDAFFSIDGLHMQSDKNSASDYIAGVTLEFHAASYDEVVSISMDRDYDAIKGKFQELVDAYNEFAKFVKESTRHGDAKEGEVGGKLSGDMTAQALVGQVKAIFQRNFDIAGTNDFSTFTMIGLKTDTMSGLLKIDEEMFSEAVRGSFEEVKSLFITHGYSDNTNIVVGMHNDDTTEGVYELEEVDAEHYRIRPINGSEDDWVLSTPRSGNVISFGSGPAKGLSVSAPAGSGNGQLVFSKGLAGHMDDIVDKLTDGRDGIVVMRQNSWAKSKDRCDDRILDLENRIESYRMRLVKQFTAMEQTLNQLTTQSANMLSQLGYYSSR